MTRTSRESFGSAWRRMCGIALMWASLSALVYVATSDGAPHGTIVALLGFAAFVLGISWFSESMKRDLVNRLRAGSSGGQS